MLFEYTTDDNGIARLALTRSLWLKKQARPKEKPTFPRCARLVKAGDGRCVSFGFFRRTRKGGRGDEISCLTSSLSSFGSLPALRAAMGLASYSRGLTIWVPEIRFPVQ